MSKSEGTFGKSWDNRFSYSACNLGLQLYFILRDQTVKIIEIKSLSFAAMTRVGIEPAFILKLKQKLFSICLTDFVNFRIIC